MTGLVQALANSNGCPSSLQVDGDYGYLTTWHVAVAQNGWLGTNNGGVMTPSMLLAVQSAYEPLGNPRLLWSGAVDGYGTQQWTYYGGGGVEAVLGWNPFSSQWLFSQYPLSNPAALVPATTNRTIGAVGPCA